MRVHKYAKSNKSLSMIICINNRQSPMIEIHCSVIETKGYSKAVIFARIMEMLQHCVNLNSLLVFRYETALRILYVKGCKHTVLSFCGGYQKVLLALEFLCSHQKVLFPVRLPLWLPAPTSAGGCRQSREKATGSDMVRSNRVCEPSSSQGRRKNRHDPRLDWENNQEDVTMQ